MRLINKKSKIINNKTSKIVKKINKTSKIVNKINKNSKINKIINKIIQSNQ